VAALHIDLDGRAAVVTGGGRGIGAAVAWALAEAGARVVVAARSEGQIEGVARDLLAAGHAARAIPCDVTDPESVARLAREAEAAVGIVDILVNNAGVASSAPLKSLELEEWNRLMAVNATGTYLCTRAFLSAMVSNGWGRVINVASVAGRTGGSYISAYAASKHAVIGFTRAVAAEVAARGVTVNAICPGFVETPMTERSVERIAAKTGLSDAAARERIVATNPQGRLIEPDEVAFLAVALCDTRARGIHGQAIGVDGGALLA
jgi:NAD(P)-dependent dehydrogenase (short-subunit alcohol dehydrogenase family)